MDGRSRGYILPNQLEGTVPFSRMHCGANNYTVSEEERERRIHQTLRQEWVDRVTLVSLSLHKQCGNTPVRTTMEGLLDENASVVVNE
jgi:hypothetical protein